MKHFSASANLRRPPGQQMMRCDAMTDMGKIYNEMEKQINIWDKRRKGISFSELFNEEYLRAFSELV